VDISEVNRIEAAITRHGTAFLKRVYTPAETAYCERHRNRFERYAGRFAAKEATMKALGTGWARGVRWVDIEVTRLATGQPTIVLHGATREHADRLGVRRISVSITHSGNTAFAQVVFES
jgi:holo-[acyl-carrier protein] synthase